MFSSKHVSNPLDTLKYLINKYTCLTIQCWALSFDKSKELNIAIAISEYTRFMCHEVVTSKDKVDIHISEFCSPLKDNNLFEHWKVRTIETELLF